MQDLHQHKRTVTDLDWSADDSMLATTANDGGVCLWLAAQGALVRRSLYFSRRLLQVCSTSDSQHSMPS